MKSYNRRLIGVGLMLLAILFGLGETVYFGGNFFPRSSAELIADTVGMTIVIAGLVLVLWRSAH